MAAARHQCGCTKVLSRSPSDRNFSEEATSPCSAASCAEPACSAGSHRVEMKMCISTDPYHSVIGSTDGTFVGDLPATHLDAFDAVGGRPHQPNGVCRKQYRQQRQRRLRYRSTPTLYRSSNAGAEFGSRWSRGGRRRQTSSWREHSQIHGPPGVSNTLRPESSRLLNDRWKKCLPKHNGSARDLTRHKR